MADRRRAVSCSSGIARIVTERVVDVLEIVEVDQEQAHARAGLFGLGERRFETVLKEVAVRKTGEGIVIGRAPDFLFGLLVLADVERHADDAVGPACSPRARSQRTSPPGIT